MGKSVSPKLVSFVKRWKVLLGAVCTIAICLPTYFLTIRCLADRAIDEAHPYLQHADLEFAIPPLTRAVKIDPGYTDAYLIRANCFVGLREFQQALDDCRKALALDPNNFVAFGIRGKALVGLEQYKDGIDSCNKCLSLDKRTHSLGADPEEAEIYKALGRAYAGLGEYETAVEKFDKSISFYPHDSSTFCDLGDAYLGLKRPAKALESYDRGIKSIPIDAPPDMYFSRGLANFQCKNNQQAIADLSKSIKLDPAHAESFFWRAQAYETVGEHSLAISDWKHARELGYEFR